MVVAMRTVSFFFAWLANWWLVVISPIALTAWGIRSLRNGKRDRAMAAAVLAVVVGWQMIPITWSSQHHQQRKLSVDIRRDVLNNPVPASFLATDEATAWLRKSGPSQKPIIRSFGDVVILARRQSIRKPEQFARSFLGEGAQFFETPADRMGIVGCNRSTSDARCAWIDSGTIGIVINRNDPGIAFDQLQRTLTSVRDQLEARSDRYHPYADAARLLLLLLSLVFVLALSIVAHEFAHAIAAKLVGNTVLGICIGMGQTLIDRRIRGVQLTVRLLPLGGYIQSVAHSPRGYRWRQCIVWAAGPFANLLLGGILGATLGPMHALTIANIALCVVNLIPFSKEIPELGRRIGTDGFQIIEFAKGRRPFVDEEPETPVARSSQESDGRQDVHESSSDWTEEAQRKNLGWLRYIAI
jgi:Peptidase family M50